VALRLIHAALAPSDLPHALSLMSATATRAQEDTRPS
jgi:hypothetical protein